MTDAPATPSVRDLVAARLKRRHAAEVRFRGFGIAMTLTAVLACGLLLFSVIAQAFPALTEHRLRLPLQVSEALIDPAGKRDPVQIRLEGDFQGLVDNALLQRFPSAEADGQLLSLKAVSESLAALSMGKTIAENPALIGTTITSSIPVNDALDLYFKGGFGKTVETKGEGQLSVAPLDDGSIVFGGGAQAFAGPMQAIRDRLAADARMLERQTAVKRQRLARAQAALERTKTLLAAAEAAGIEARIETAKAAVDAAGQSVAAIEDEIATDSALQAAFVRESQGTDGVLALDGDKPSVLIEAGGGVWRATTLAANQVTATQIVRPTRAGPHATWTLVQLAAPENARPIKDSVIAHGRALKADGLIRQQLNTTILTRSDSNEPELAGLLSAIVGSILTLVITFCTAVPIGVMTAIYLEEFAPKNRVTDFIEVNINNLAAVPSIVFGLLGFSVFLTFFGMPRSAPVVGGIVLTLMSLPIIIIASRAALKAVPPSIREAALGVGASKMQAIFHHVLPLAMPGIMTGSILAMAHALGETAPLLMIGMVAFIADVPGSFTDSATVLPVEIYMWASRPERAWEPRTSLAIIVLLLFMIAMNAAAIYVRRRFERRW